MRKGNMSFSCNLAVHGAVSTNLFHQVEIFHHKNPYGLFFDIFENR